MKFIPLEVSHCLKRTSRLNVLANGLTECFVQDKPVAVSGVYYGTSDTSG